MKTFFVPKQFMYETPEDAVAATVQLWGKPRTVVEVTTFKGSSVSDEEAVALANVFGYYNKQFQKPKRIEPFSANKGALTEGGRLTLAAYRDARAEVEAAAIQNTEEDVLGGWTVQEFAETILYSVIDWGYDNWYRDRSGKMGKYFTPASLFRKGKWRDRARWPDTRADAHEEGW